MRVPRYIDSVPLRGRHKQSRSLSISPEQFGAGIGRGLQQVAQGIGSVAEAVDYRDQIKAEADAREATNAYREAVRTGLYAPDTGYMTQTGGNALDGARENTLGNLEKARSEIAQGLSPRARRIFDQKADGLDNSARDSAIKHEGVQFRDFTLDTFEASAQGYLDDALLNSHSDEKFNQNMAAAADEVRAASALQGDSPEVVQQKLERLQSSGHSGRIVEVARTDPVRAFEYLQEHRDEIDGAQYQKLHDGLEPVYYQAQARDWVAKQNVTTAASGSADVDQYGVPYWISGPESGGDPNAANPASSARGATQFIDDTYLSYVKKVNPTWAEGLTDAEILETRTDRKKEGQIYRAFRADNQRMLRSWGREVTPRNEYMMHHLGPKVTSTMLAAEDLDATQASFKGLVEAVLGEAEAAKWVEANPWMEGKTTAGALRWFEGKVGRSPGGVANPALAMRQALEIKDPKLRAAVMSELKLRVSVAETVRAENMRIASEKAWSVIDEGRPPSDIPPDIQVEAGAQVMNTIFNAYERRQIGVDVTDEGRHLELLDMANGSAEQQKRFMELDLNDDRPNLSRSDLLTLKGMQTQMLEDQRTMEKAGAAAVIYKDSDYRSAMEDASEQYQAAVGVAPGAKMTQEQVAQYNRFTQQLRSGMRSFANENGRAMTFEERTNFINTLLAPVVIDGVDLKSGFGKGTYLFDAPLMARDGAAAELQLDRTAVPPVEEERIKERLTKSFGRAPSEDEIVEQYENELLLSVGVSPNIEFSEIPRDIRRRIMEQNPGVSREEAVDIFLVVTLEAAQQTEAR